MGAEANILQRLDDATTLALLKMVQRWLEEGDIEYAKAQLREAIRQFSDAGKVVVATCATAGSASGEPPASDTSSAKAGS